MSNQILEKIKDDKEYVEKLAKYTISQHKLKKKEFYKVSSLIKRDMKLTVAESKALRLELSEEYKNPTMVKKESKITRLLKKIDRKNNELTEARLELKMVLENENK